MKRAAFILVLILCILNFSAVHLYANPQKITWSDLEACKDGKHPKNSEKLLDSGLFGKDGLIYVEVITPKGQAAQFAKYANENFISLDSSNYNPDIFNKFVELQVYNLAPDLKDAKQIKRCVIEISGKLYEADSTEYISETLQNLYGASVLDIDANFYFNIEIFDGEGDIIFHIIHDSGKFDRKLKSKDLKKLE